MDMISLRKMRKNAKALSPVVASIILIAVTVAVSVVVAAWMGGMSIGLMGSTEEVSITNVVLSTTGTGPYNGVATCTVQNTGSSSATINTATIDGAATTITGGTVTIQKGTTQTVTLTTVATSPTTPYWGTYAKYTVSLQTAKGHSVVYTVSN